jgi:hypothetical protein
MARVVTSGWPGAEIALQTQVVTQSMRDRKVTRGQLGDVGLHGLQQRLMGYDQVLADHGRHPASVHDLARYPNVGGQLGQASRPLWPGRRGTALHLARLHSIAGGAA